MSGMFDLDGFVRVGCMTADLLRAHMSLRVASSLTDISGVYGEPTIFTEWETKESECVAMKEYRWTHDPSRDCEHWVPAPGFDFAAYREARS